MNPNEATKQLTPPDLATQLFDAAFVQYKNDHREAARQVIVFLTETLVYAISSSAGDEAARKALLKSVGESIAAAPTAPAGPPGKP
jgi:nicotinamide mononucleotide (NMN) deamidase PncC